jgi:hypothetical protein
VAELSATISPVPLANGAFVASFCVLLLNVAARFTTGTVADTQLRFRSA